MRCFDDEKESFIQWLVIGRLECGYYRMDFAVLFLSLFSSFIPTSPIVSVFHFFSFLSLRLWKAGLKDSGKGVIRLRIS